MKSNWHRKCSTSANYKAPFSTNFASVNIVLDHNLPGVNKLSLRRKQTVQLEVTRSRRSCRHRTRLAARVATPDASGCSSQEAGKKLPPFTTPTRFFNARERYSLSNSCYNGLLSEKVENFLPLTLPSPPPPSHLDPCTCPGVKTDSSMASELVITLYLHAVPFTHTPTPRAL